jgi:Protein of unknown function (DUF3563)
MRAQIQEQDPVMLFKLFHLVHLVWAWFARTEPARNSDEAYLAQSSDIYDLERRIRALDERGRNPDQAIVFGLYTR